MQSVADQLAELLEEDRAHGETEAVLVGAAEAEQAEIAGVVERNQRTGSDLDVLAEQRVIDLFFLAAANRLARLNPGFDLVDDFVIGEVEYE